MDFLAPEYALESECTAASDMFSLGMVAFALYNTKLNRALVEQVMSYIGSHSREYYRHLRTSIQTYACYNAARRLECETKADIRGGTQAMLDQGCHSG